MKVDNSRTLPTLQALRFVFVMMIFMSHFVYGGVGAFDAGGDCGVAFFFLLSGFVVSLGYGRQLSQHTFSYGRFMRRRLLKIYPLHLLCLAAFLVISRQTVDLRVVLNALLLQCWVPQTDYYFSCNAVSWFLSCMLFCYLVFPLLYRYASGRLLAVVAVAYGAVCLAVPYDMVNNILYVNPLVRCVDFYLGIMLCKVYESRRPVLSSVGSWAEPLLLALLVASLVVYPYADAKLRNAPLYWLVLMPFILVFARGEGLLSRLLRCRAMQWLGSLSMPVFMLHTMTFAVLMHHLPVMPYWAMLGVCVVAVVALSWAVDRFFLRLFR